MSTNTDINAAIDGLLKWWHRRFGPLRGQRNANTYILAAALNNYGIPYADALATCLRYVDTDPSAPFTAAEITDIVVSAYRRTEHGVRQWRAGASPQPVAQEGSRSSMRYTAEQHAALVERITARLLRQHTAPLAITLPKAPTSPTAAPAPQPEQPASPLDRLLAKFPAITLLVEELDLDLSRANVKNIIP